MKKIYLVFIIVMTAVITNAQTTLISATGDGGFETGITFALNNWTAVNNTTNTWQVGSASTPFAGASAGFISNDGGTTYAYTLTSSQTSHFYRDITVPAGETKIQLSFQWKGSGESGFDRLLVYTAPTSVLPVAGTPASSSTTLTGATLVFTQPSYSQATYTSSGAIILPASLAGTTFRLIFTWQNDAGGGTSPGASIDNISLTSAVPTSFTSTITGGLWSATTTWVGGIVPGTGDNVTIVDGANVTIDTNPTLGTLTVGGGTSGILQYDATARAVTTGSDVTIATGAIFRSAASGSISTVITHALSVGGNLTNNGTLNFSATAGASGTTANASGALLTFTNSTDATFNVSASTAITNLRSTTGLTVNKGSSNTSILNFTPTTTYQSAASATGSTTTITVGSTTGLAVGMYVSVTAGIGSFAANTIVSSITNATSFVVSTAPTTALSGGASVVTASKFGVLSASLLTTATAGFLTITNGTFKIGGSNTFLHPYFNVVGYSIPATGGFWLNNSNATVTALTGSPTISGLLRLTAGIFNQGTASGSISGATTSSFIIEGGTMNIAGRFNINSSGAQFNMSAGTMNVCTVANGSSATPSFGFTSATSVFIMSGGTINLVQRTTGATVLDYQVSTTSPTITGGTLNIGTAATITNFIFGIQGAMPNVVIDNTTNNKTANLVAAASSYGTTTINSGATLNLNGFSYTQRGTTFTNNGILTGTTTSSRLSFFSSSAQTLAGSGTVLTNIDGLSVQNSSGLTITHANPIITLRVNLFQGIVTNSNKITLGTGAVLTAITQIGASGLAATAGSYDQSPTFNLGVGAYNVSYLEETAARTTSFEIPATRTVTNITVANNNNATLSGGLLNISGVLTLNGGKLITTVTNLPTVTATATTAVVRSTYTSAASATSSGTTVTVGSTSTLSAGMNVTVTAGTGAFASNTTVVSVLSTTTFSVSTTPTTALSAATVSGAGGWVSGPIAITLPASLVSGSTYLLPVGKGTYNPLELVNPTTNASGTVTIKSEVFDANAGGTSGINMGVLNTDRYWASSITAGAANFTNTLIKLTDASSASASAIATSITLAGSYDIVGGSSPIIVAGTSVTNSAPAATSLPGFYVLGTKLVNMSYTSSTTTQALTTNIFTNTTNQQIIGLQVVTTGNASPINATSFTLNTTGTTNAAIDITNAKLWYTGISSTFATTTQFGTTNATPSSSYTITGTQTLVEGTNYFWLTYDIPNTATVNNLVDAEFTSVTVGGISTPTPTVTAPVGTRTIKAQLNGVYSIGALQVSPNYTTLANAITDLNLYGVSGAVTFQLVSDYNTASETYPLVINAFAGASASNTLTIKPAAGVTTAITGSVASGALIKLNGADYVIIDGSNNGSTSRNLTITNSATTSPTVVSLISLGVGAGATNNTIKNCNISTGVSAAAGFGIAVGGSIPGSNGADNDNVTIQNNSITIATIPIYAIGTASTTTGGNDNLSIIGNSVTTNTTIQNFGIQVGNGLNSSISQNIVSVETSGAAPPVGISIQTGFNNSVVSKNVITKVLATSTGGYGGRGITIGTGMTGSNLTISNNMISGVNGSNFSAFGNSSSMGIAVGIIGSSGTLTTTTGGVNINYNSINLTGNHSYTTLTITAGLYVGSGATALDVRNNIFVNSLNNTTTANSKDYAVYSDALPAAFTSINYNDYFGLSSTNSTALVGFISGADQATLFAWKTATAQDVNSVSGNPNYTSASDLHINTALPTILDGTATPITGITSDIDGDTRNATTPDIGADEFVSLGCSGQPAAGIITPTAASKCVGQTYTISASGLTTATDISYQWQVATTTGGPYSNVTGGTGATTSTYTTGALTAGVYYYVLKTTCTSSSQSNITNEVTVTVNALPTVSVTPTSSTICQPGATAVPLTASGTTTYTWSPTTGLTPSTGANVSALPTVTTTYTVTGTDGNGCVNTATSVITVNAAPIIASVTATPTTVCSGSSSQLLVSVNMVPNYSLTSSTNTFTPIIGGTTITGGNADTYFSGLLPIGFNFNYNGATYSNFYFSSNGFISFTSTIGSATTNALVSATSPVIAPLWDDLDGASVGSASYTTTGIAPNRVLTVEWLNWEWGYLANAATISFQAKIYETSGLIEFNYRQDAGALSSPSASIGISGTAGSYLSLNNSSASPVASNSVETTNISIKPATDQLYRFTPPVLTYSWSPTTGLSDPTIANPVASNITANTTYNVSVSNGTCTSTGSVTVNLATYNTSVITQPSTAAVAAGSANNIILLIDAPQACVSENLTQLDFTNASTAPTDVSVAKVYYNTTNTFSTATLFGTTSTPGATFIVTGSQALSTSTRNYIWLVYDIACNAVNANTVDGGITSFVVGAGTFTPTPSNPTGIRAITGLAASILTVQPSTATVQGGNTNQQVLRVLIPATSCGPVTSFTFNTNGSTNAATDISKARVYYTTTTTFAITTQFGTDAVSPNGSFIITGSQVLSTTLSNYFWLVYDINCAATAANVVDAEVNSVTTGGNAYTPTTINPVGTRAILALYAPSRIDGNGTTSIQLGTQNAPFVYSLISGSATCPGTVTAVNFTATNPNSTDVVNAKCYYTTTSTFSTTNQFGTSIANLATGVQTFTGSQLLATGNNYFWVVYDINCNGTLAASLNADINSLVVSGATIPVTGTATAANALTAIVSYTTVADGEWSNTATWTCGNVPPNNATPVIIANAITVSNAGNIGGSVTINAGKSLIFNAGGNLTLGTVGGGNRTLINNGTLAVSSGTLNMNGNIVNNTGSLFNQSGGSINIDGNASGSIANSVASGTALLQFNQLNNGINLTGGVLTIIDPHAAATATTVVGVDNGTVGIQTSTVNHTLRLGDGTSTDAGGNIGGFIIDPWTSSEFLSFGNIVVNGALGTNRIVTSSYQLAAVGDIIINANSTLNTTSSIVFGRNLNVNLSGSFINTGGASAAIVASNTSSTLTFGSTNLPQSISNFGVIANASTSPSANMTSLTVNNSHASGIILNSPISISGTLTMTAGRINTDATNLLTLGYNATNAGTLSFTAGSIVGPFKRWITAATGVRQFPMGNGTSLKNASLNFTTVPTTAGTLTARWSTTAPSFPNASALMEGAITVNKASSQGSWFIDAADGLAGGTYSGTFTANGSSDVVDFSKAVLIKRPSAGGDWILDGTHVTTTGSNTAPVLNRTGMTGFSEFALGGENNAVLPVSIAFFRGSKLAAANYLDWKVTCTSQPSVQLSLERSADGRNFTAIDDQTATATRCLQGFNYTDTKPLAGSNYYRLKTTSPDGKISYSTIVVLLSKENGFELISLVPNPVQHTAILSLTTVKGGKIEISVSDVAGKVITKKSTIVVAGNNPINMNFATFGAGTYIISAINDLGELKTTRFVKL